MAPDADPYRTLGLERGASLDEVKRAYRRLAKANHPDAAGESALPRFLAIQAAYDQIAGPDARTRRPGVGGAGGSSAARRAWEADPDRAGATHRAYGGRPRSRPGPRARPSSPPGARASRPPRSDRPPNKATLGSTSYDGAEAEPLDPDWGGASWYGTSSGTYWTLNPKEYADPRKHGPEYQARARRADERKTAASTPPSETLAADAEPASVVPDPPDASDAPDAPDAPVTPDAPTHTATSWWRPTSADRPPDAAASPRPSPAPPQRSGAAEPPLAGEGPAISTDAALDSIRAWLDDRRPGVGARIGRAVAGWAPIALGIGWAAGEVTGCSRFSASCPAAVAPLTWGAQIAVLALLILVPRFARVATVATIATLAAVLPASVLLLATSDPASVDAARAVLGGLMAIAWVAGVAYGAAREFRRRPIGRPVS
jgi:curved DNA-binding protein CbpA